MFHRLLECSNNRFRCAPGMSFMPAPSSGGSLVSLDGNVVVQPPAGYELGYVPIVTHQFDARNSAGMLSSVLHSCLLRCGMCDACISLCWLYSTLRGMLYGMLHGMLLLCCMVCRKVCCMYSEPILHACCSSSCRS